jgi:hypothetical protein
MSMNVRIHLVKGDTFTKNVYPGTHYLDHGFETVNINDGELTIFVPPGKADAIIAAFQAVFAPATVNTLDNLPV